MQVSRRARRYEDRNGDPLDGLVNLFDLGIVLSVAFLIAALSSLDLTRVLADEQAASRAAAAADSVTVEQDEQAKEIRLDPGEEVVGTGREVGRVYRLDDGRTIIVRPKDERAGAGSP